MDKPLKSVPHGQCDARPTVTFPTAYHHRPLIGIKLYCFVTEAHVCEQLCPRLLPESGTAEIRTRDLRHQATQRTHNLCTATSSYPVCVTTLIRTCVFAASQTDRQTDRQTTRAISPTVLTVRCCFFGLTDVLRHYYNSNVIIVQGFS